MSFVVNDRSVADLGSQYPTTFRWTVFLQPNQLKPLHISFVNHHIHVTNKDLQWWVSKYESIKDLHNRNFALRVDWWPMVSPKRRVSVLMLWCRPESYTERIKTDAYYDRAIHCYILGNTAGAKVGISQVKLWKSRFYTMFSWSFHTILAILSFVSLNEHQ